MRSVPFRAGSHRTVRKASKNNNNGYMIQYMITFVTNERKMLLVSVKKAEEDLFNKYLSAFYVRPIILNARATPVQISETQISVSS